MASIWHVYLLFAHLVLVHGNLKCLHKDEVGTVEELKSSQGNGSLILPVNDTVTCKPKEKCFTFWLSESNVILKAGCWGVNTEHDCDDVQCISHIPKAANLPEDTRFCCCLGDLCNSKFVNVHNATIFEYEDDEESDEFIEPVRRKNTTYTIVAVVSIVALACAIVFLIFLVYRRFTIRKKLQDIAGQGEMLLDKTSSISSRPASCVVLDDGDFALIEFVGRGSYGEVWLAEFSGDLEEEGGKKVQKVAVKLFTGNNAKQLQANERDIYSLPGMAHSSFPIFFGVVEEMAVQRDSCTTTHCGIVLEHIAYGPLQNYLKKNSVDFPGMCRMVQSVASGLAYLHNEINAPGNLEKPAIVHRDINSKNILVKDNLECVICDFGFAMAFKESTGKMQDGVDQSSLIHVGTIRYMAPEILEGAVNLKECCISLKQIDVYAMGLVLWEISTRCHELYQGLPVPEYHLPFQLELGANLTFDDVQLTVCKNKMRPLFPDVWKDSNPVTQALKQTIEDCWDQDAEARLTACCVEERLAELEPLWDCNHKGLLFSSNFQIERPQVNKKPELCNMSSDSLPPAGPADVQLSTPIETNDVSSSTVDVQEVSNVTAQTMLSPDGMTGTQPGIGIVQAPPNVSNPYPYEMYFSRRNQREPLPCHAKNPVAERNTHKRSDEDLEFQGNAVTKRDANKDATPVNQQPQQQEADVANMRREIAPPIPYLHNDVASEPVLVCPKQPNLPVQNKNDRQKKGNFLDWLSPRLKLPFMKNKDTDVEAGVHTTTNNLDFSGEELQQITTTPASVITCSSVNSQAGHHLPQHTPRRPDSLVLATGAATTSADEKSNLKKLQQQPILRDGESSDQNSSLQSAASPTIMPSPYRRDDEPLI